ncbi:hypothetical protein PGT21_036552 [Puccinia graminis f. sp. tritici]|nr:hypothetical protein PGT21_036552 [Puccinia graminis f. sp. tritici]
MSTNNKAAISNAGTATTSLTPNQTKAEPLEVRGTKGEISIRTTVSPPEEEETISFRDGTGASGYPFGFRYPLTISAKSDIRIRWRIPADIRPKNDPQAAK